jgi:SHS2 domain-containing protein
MFIKSIDDAAHSEYLVMRVSDNSVYLERILMAFEEVLQQRSSPREQLHAVLSVAKRGVGNLRITVAGVEKLRELRVPLKCGDRAKVFFDKATGQIAIQKSENGIFKLSRNSQKNDTMRITSKVLGSKIKKLTRFRMEASGKFDVVLLPAQ